MIIVEKKMRDLTAQERKVLSALDELNYEASVEDIQGLTGISQSGVMRSALSLEEKGFLKIQRETKRKIFITEEGKTYLKDSLPERKVLELLPKKGPLLVVQLSDEIDLPEEKIGISIGWAKLKGWVNIAEEDGKKFLR